MGNFDPVIRQEWFFGLFSNWELNLEGIKGRFFAFKEGRI